MHAQNSSQDSIRNSIQKSDRTDAQAQPGVLLKAQRIPLHSKWLRVAVCCVLLLCVAFFVAGTVHWRTVNDAAQINYACFMMDHGMSPYRDMIEMNMPGIYLVNWSVMHGLGPGSLAWRIFDFLIVGVAGLAMVAIAMPYDWLAGVFAGVLFALFHGRDGPSQMGQRDLIIATLLLCSVWFLFEALRREKIWLLFFGGLCAAAAITIKPTAVAFSVVLLVAACLRQRRMKRSAWLTLAWSGAGAALPFAGVYAFLAAKGSLTAFGYVLQRMLPFYARLGRVSFGYLVSHLLTPSLVILLLLGVAAAALNQHDGRSENSLLEKRRWERLILLLGMALGALSYFTQGTGFPYHRYPMVVFLFLWIGIEVARALRQPGRPRLIALAAVLVGLVLAPIYAARARERAWDESYNRALLTDLSTLGGSNISSLSGRVLCLTTPGDCDTTLYRLKLVQDSGLFYDYFIFGDGNNPVIVNTRQRLLPVLLSSPPEIVILDRGLYPQKTGGYDKLKTWPELDRFISARYMLYTDREFKIAECGQRGYRLYVLNAAPSPNAVSVNNKYISASK